MKEKVDEEEMKNECSRRAKEVRRGSGTESGQKREAVERGRKKRTSRCAA